MRPFSDLPIRKKLTVVIVLANVLALVLVGVASAIYEVSLFRRAAIREASIQAELVGTFCVSALARNNPGEAQNRLAILAAQDQIVAAQLFTANGTLLAEYPTDAGKKMPAAASLMQKRTLNESYAIRQDHVLVTKPVLSNSQPVGTLVLLARTNELEQHLEAGLGTVVAALLISTVVALLVSLKVQRTVSDPIQHLARVVSAVGTKSDYSLRAVKRGNDEIGALIDGVNKMLDEIHTHQKELQTSEERFRQVTESIREVFWMTNVEKNQMIYISPSYEEVWGRTSQTLYAIPWDWLEGVHADDRERVLRAVKSKQIAGTYDEEFRVVRPDGSIRWIRDRAFPVFDKGGKIYRMAGIAEDVTERKRLEREVLDISDREQERLGQDLHDGLCQHLVSIAMTASLLKRRLAGVANPEARIAERICSQLEDAVAQARSLARGICSLDLAEDNLPPALRELALSTTREYGIPCHVDFAEPLSIGDAGVVTNLYRIAREAVYNAAKHARPNLINIEVKAHEDVITLKVSDDGVGIDNPPKNSSGMGLGLMKYRASMIGAELKIERSLPGGTVMTCNLPRIHI